MWPRSRADGASRALALGAGLLAVLAIVLAYAAAFGASFQFDDWNVIVREPRVQSVRAWWDSMPGIRPLLKLSYALNHATGLGAPGFHAFNVVLHVINAWLVLALLRRWPGGVQGLAAVAAPVAALVFALHPVQTEAVTYVSGRSVSFAALFSLSSMLAWVAGQERGSRVLANALSPLLFACALATRETAAVLPCALVLWRATAGPRAGGLRAALASTAAHWAVLAAAVVAAFAMPDYRRFFATAFEARPLVAQVLTEVNAVGYLTGQLVRFDRLNADPMLPVITSVTPAVIVQALALAAAVAFGLANLRRRPAIAFGVLWYFLWLVPTNSLVPRFDVVNDRQLYLALIGPAWLAGLGIAALWRRWPQAVGALTVTLMIGLAFATHTRNDVYADEVVFWQDVVRKTPGNARAFNNLGYAWALAGRNADAERAFRQALALDPVNTKAALNLVMLREGTLLPPGRGAGVAIE